MAWKEWNPNPCGKTVGDCAVRAVAALLGVTWKTAFEILCAEAREQCDLPSSDAVWGAVLRKHGFARHAVSNGCPDCYDATDFALEHPRGEYALAFGGHVAALINGVLLDSWDSSHEVPIYFYFRR